MKLCPVVKTIVLSKAACEIGKHILHLSNDPLNSLNIPASLTPLIRLQDARKRSFLAVPVSPLCRPIQASSPHIFPASHPIPPAARALGSDIHRHPAVDWRTVSHLQSSTATEMHSQLEISTVVASHHKTTTLTSSPYS